MGFSTRMGGQGILSPHVSPLGWGPRGRLYQAKRREAPGSVTELRGSSHRKRHEGKSVIKETE